MAIEFTTIKNINYGAFAAVDGLVNKSFAFWINYTADASDNAPIIEKDGDDGGWSVQVGIDSLYSLIFAQVTNDTPGIWINTGGSIAPNTWVHGIVTYNNSNTTTNPIFYINGVQKSTFELNTPTGTIQGDSGTASLSIGDDIFSKSPVGKVQDVRIYNRILSADEVYSLYANRRIGYMRNGLVFHAPMIGAAGLTKFDGSTLGATNYVWDVVNNAAGTPVGNPVGAGNTIQRIN